MSSSFVFAEKLTELTQVINLPKTVVTASIPSEVINDDVAYNEVSYTFQHQFDAVRTEDILALAPAVNSYVKDGGVSTGLNVRGFNISKTFVDGVPDINRLFVRDSATLERVTFISGANSLHHAVNSISGYVNQQTKQPKFNKNTANATSSFTFSQNNLNQPNRKPDVYKKTRLAYDLGGPIGNNFALRVSGAMQIGKNGVGLTQDKQHHLLGLAWRSNNQRHKTVAQVEAQSSHIPYDFGTVVLGKEIKLDKNYTDATTKTTRQYIRTALGYEYNTSNYSAKAQLAHAHAKRNETLHGFWSFADDNTLSGYANDIKDNYKQDDALLSLSYLSALPAWLLVHADKWQIHTKLQTAWHKQYIDFYGKQHIADFSVDILNPVLLATTYPQTKFSPRYLKQDYQYKSIGLSQTLASPSQKWLMTVGGKYTDYQIKRTKKQDIALDTSTKNYGKNIHISSRYNMPDNVSVFANYDRTITPVTGSTKSGKFLKPKTLQQKEIGIYLLKPLHSGLFSAQMSLFHLRRYNLVKRNPDDRRYLINAGSATSYGINLFGKVALANSLSLKINGQWLKTQDQHKKDFVGTPQYKWSSSISKKTTLFGQPTNLGLHWLFVGKRPVTFKKQANHTYITDFEVPSHQRFDVSGYTTIIKKQPKQSEVIGFFRIMNIFNHAYLQDISSKDVAYVNSPRTATIGLKIIGF